LHHLPQRSRIASEHMGKPGLIPGGEVQIKVSQRTRVNATVVKQPASADAVEICMTTKPRGQQLIPKRWQQHG
jgi:hypothetical protein